MKLTMEEKEILYAYGCSSWKNTVERLKWLTALAVDPEKKHRLLELAGKVDRDTTGEWYSDFYYFLRREMDGYFRAKRQVHDVEMKTDYEEDMYGEAV